MRMTETTVTFSVPEYAFKILKIMSKQNNAVFLELNEEEGKITLGAELFEFYEYMDDEDDIAAFEDSALEVKK